MKKINSISEIQVTDTYSAEELRALTDKDSIEKLEKAELFLIIADASDQFENFEKIEKINTKTTVEEVNEILKVFEQTTILDSVVFKLYKHGEALEAFETYGRNRFNIGYVYGREE